MTSPIASDLVERLSATMKLADDWAMTREGRDGSGLMVQCLDRMGEAKRALTQLQNDNRELRETLEKAERDRDELRMNYNEVASRIFAIAKGTTDAA